MNTPVVLAVTIVGGSSLLRVWQSPNLDRPAVSLRIVAGSFLLGAVLSLVDSAAPSVASGIAILIITSALLLNIGAITTAITAVTGKG